MTNSDTNPLVAANKAGQSLWLDYIQRSMIGNGDLLKLINDDHIAGLTSNPSIFEQAIAKTDEYDESIRAIVRQDPSIDNLEVFNRLAIEDIQAAADVFADVYKNTQGEDGMVSLEVSPKLAHDTAATVISAQELHRRVNRPNLMIKVPGTAAGVSAFQQLTAAGISVNVTLLFSITRYREIAQAYVAGLEERAAQGHPVNTIASVASFFVSRVDSEVDAALVNAAPDTKSDSPLSGKIAIANAKVAYGHFANLFGSAQFQKLQAKGAKPQRLLWASTGTKNPAYSDVLYVEELIGPNTVNTLPPKTMDAFRDHGSVEPRLTSELGKATDLLSQLSQTGISLAEITRKLEVAGIESFDEAFDRLLASIDEKRKSLTA